MAGAHSKEEVLGRDMWGLFLHFARATTSITSGRILVTGWALGSAASLALGVWQRIEQGKERNKKRKDALANTATPKGPRPAPFSTQLMQILRVAFPKKVHKTWIYLALYTLSLILRIIITIKIAKTTGKLGKMVGAKTFTEMFQLQVIFSLWCYPAAVINSAMSYTCNLLSLSIRDTLLGYIHKTYMKDLLYYRSANVGRNRMEDVDTRVTQDVKKFSSQVSELYGNLVKPTLEVIFLSRTLSGLMGTRQLMGFFGFFFIAGQWLRFVMPRFAAMHAEHSKLEGVFRSGHTRLINHCEEIAFYGGSEREKEIIDENFKAVKKLSNKQYFLQALMGVLDSYLVKYGASMVAYSMLIPAVYLGLQGLKGKSTSEIMEYYLTCTQLFVSLGAACKHLVLSYKSVQALAGLTTRISELLTMLKSRANKEDEKEMLALAWNHKDRTGGPPKVIIGDSIAFDNVDIFSPTGELLAKSLTFEVKKNTNVLVSGRNGCGKSSLFRIVGGLWPLCSGTLTKPEQSKLFYIPQKPYMVPGTLRDQITYPHHCGPEVDSKLKELLSLVEADYLVPRFEGAWDAVQDWADVLSGGEKQRVAMARLFYHKPDFGILDECTSAVSADVEAKIYETCQKLGITIFTVSHRPQLKHHHDYEFRFDGEGGWSWNKLEKSGEEVHAEQQQSST